MTSQERHVRVGVAAIIQDGRDRVLMGIRKGSHGAGHWQFPGGHLEMGETYFQCAERETLEETGLKVHAEKLVTITNDIFSDTKHYITIFVKCRRGDNEQQPQATEPDKCAAWSWISLSELKDLYNNEAEDQKLFLPILNLIRENDSALHSIFH
ncbi:Nudix hydrolase 1 [Diplogelasinospora grovesii]|uniref:Nudix hydrolase 1 n=1 Tax=Diplogelasinospora grovesii TaxID=303347 RepID=A0AAN6N2X0_9PEZI|nr:Nudix hydrolase 1 [Diplogelasinospora grovesii]